MRKLSFLLWLLLLLNGVSGNEMKVSVTKGNDVTLSRSAEVQRTDQIVWKFKSSIIVRVEEAVGIYNTSIDGRFRDRLKLNNKTGSLTITSVKFEDQGLYQLDINNENPTQTKLFNVTVIDMKTMPCMEGDSFSVNIDAVQKDDQIRFKFRDKDISIPRLNEPDGSNIHLNDQTGELQFKNIQRNQSGVYEVEINTSSLILHMKFRVTVDESNTEMEGDSVTLNPDLTQIQGINQIQWRFGVSGSVIAETVGNEISYPYLTEKFGGRLQLDHQTGSLTINNTRTKHSGLYKLQISHNTGTSYMTLSVNVSESKDAFIDVGEAEMKTLSVMAGYPVTLQTDVTETHGDELIVWRFGDEGKLIAKCDLEAKSSTLYMTDERFRDRQLDHQTGSLTITHTRTTDSGLYRVKISSNKQTIYKRFTVAVSDPGLSAGAVAGIVVAVLLVFAAVAGVIYHRRKIS